MCEKRNGPKRTCSILHKDKKPSGKRKTEVEEKDKDLIDLGAQLVDKRQFLTRQWSARGRLSKSMVYFSLFFCFHSLFHFLIALSL